MPRLRSRSGLRTLLLLAGFCAVASDASAQRTAPRSATVFHGSNNRTDDGYTNFAVEYRYQFINCVGDLMIAYVMVPGSISTTYSQYRYRGQTYPILPTDPPPRLEAGTFRGAVYDARNVHLASFNDPYTHDSEVGGGCLGQTQRVGQVRQLVGPNATPESILAYLNTLQARVGNLIEPVRNGAIEARIEREIQGRAADARMAQARRDSISRAARQRRDSVDRAYEADRQAAIQAAAQRQAAIRQAQEAGRIADAAAHRAVMDSITRASEAAESRRRAEEQRFADELAAASGTPQSSSQPSGGARPQPRTPAQRRADSVYAAMRRAQRAWQRAEDDRMRRVADRLMFDGKWREAKAYYQDLATTTYDRGSAPHFRSAHYDHALEQLGQIEILERAESYAEMNRLVGGAIGISGSGSYFPADQGFYGLTISRRVRPLRNVVFVDLRVPGRMIPVGGSQADEDDGIVDAGFARSSYLVAIGGTVPGLRVGGVGLHAAYVYQATNVRPLHLAMTGLNMETGGGALVRLDMTLVSGKPVWGLSLGFNFADFD